MVDATHKRFQAFDRSYHALIKREVHTLAANEGFDKKKLANLDLVVAEMTSNLHKYTPGGELLVGICGADEERVLEIICIDNGPGMGDVSKMLSDGYSSGATLGHGFGSMKRLSDFFDVYSMKGWGTILLSRIYKQEPPPLRKTRKAIRASSLVLAKPLEQVSGDGFYMKGTDQMVKMILADGLGHGPEANLAVNEAVRAFKQCPYDSPVEIIRYLHASVRKTRGLVGTVVVFDKVSKQIRIAGVGNIAAKFYNASIVKGHLAYNGIIGHNIPNTMNDQIIESSVYNELILCSDGIRSRWDTLKYPVLSRYDPMMLAAAIYKDFGRQTDDMSVVITKFKF